VPQVAHHLHGIGLRKFGREALQRPVRLHIAQLAFEAQCGRRDREVARDRRQRQQ